MKRSKKGFTLAELLIVIAIIAILIAVMFPVFGAQLDKARAAAELANVRAKYSEMVAEQMLGEGNNLTSVENFSIKINVVELAKAMQQTTSTVSIKITAGTNAGDPNTADSEVTVTYGKYSGTFKADKDVTFTAGESAYTSESKYKNDGSSVS